MSKQNNLSISEKISQLDKLVAWFDSEDFSIEEAIERYQQAETLANEIEKDLEAVKENIKVVKKRFDE